MAALDMGDRRIGYAVSDPTGTIASRTGAWVRAASLEGDYATVAALVQENEVGTLVIGHPVHLSGRVGAQARKVQEFVEGLMDYFRERNLECRLALWDERLTSVMAEQYLRELEPSRRGRDQDKGRVDAMSAGVILQSYLERGEAEAYCADED